MKPPTWVVGERLLLPRGALSRLSDCYRKKAISMQCLRLNWREHGHTGLQAAGTAGIDVGILKERLE